MLPEAFLPVLNTLSTAPLAHTPALEQEHDALASRLVTLETMFKQLQAENDDLRERNKAQANNTIKIVEWSQPSSRSLLLQSTTLVW